MKIPLYDGLREHIFTFNPEQHTWKKETHEFLIGVETGLPAPLDRVFLKRVRGEAVPAHNLLIKLIGQILPGSPRFLGYAKQGQSHYYAFHNISGRYRLLERELTNADMIRPQIVLAVVSQAARLFPLLFTHGYVYIDFRLKNIMVDPASNRIVLIDIDSSWPVTLLETQAPKSGVDIEFWGLWNQHIRKTAPRALENAHKTLVLSFAAVWSRAIAIAHKPETANRVGALTLVLSPSYPREQRALWDALAAENRQGFLDYFLLGRDLAAGAYAYNEWREVFRAFRSGRIVSWREITSACETLLIAIRQALNTRLRTPSIEVTAVVKVCAPDDFTGDLIKANKSQWWWGNYHGAF